MSRSPIRNRRFGIAVFVLLAMASAQPMHAQDPVADQRNAWLMYFGNHRLTDRWGLHTELQWRRHDGFEHWQQSLVRVGADYYTPAGPMISAGYGWVVSFPYGEQPIAYGFNEHRIWQQFLLAQSAWRAQFQHRFRLEQRFMEQRSPDGEGGTRADGHQFKQRARYRFMVTVPLSRKELLDNTLFLAAYDEVFVQFGRHVGANVLDQNRLYAALGWRFNTNVNVQLGYLNQYVFKADGVRAERNHTLQVGLVYNLDLRGE